VGPLSTYGWARAKPCGRINRARCPSGSTTWVAKFPNNVMIVDSSTACTSGDMSARADTIAAALARQTGVSKGSCVGVSAGPSLDAVLSLLAIHGAGAVYVPAGRPQLGREAGQYRGRVIN
jgi:acyl-CoA synthetase (AMP-forming)/AMP-acid ligase II